MADLDKDSTIFIGRSNEVSPRVSIPADRSAPWLLTRSRLTTWEPSRRQRSASVDALAGTSMVNPIESNGRGRVGISANSCVASRCRKSWSVIDPVSGKTVQALAGVPPAGYGAKAQVRHAARVRE